MTRRGFLTRVLTAPLVAALALRRPTPRPVDHLSAPTVWPDGVRGNDGGLSIRFIKQFDVRGMAVSRFDVLYGMGCLAPGTIVRVAS